MIALNLNRGKLSFALTGLVLLSGLATLAADSPGQPSDSLRVMTYNLRFASSTGANAWPQRRPIMHELIETISPDLMGTQEGLHDQLTDIAHDLTGYAWIGVGRDDGKSAGEFMALFYRKSRLEPISTNYFWLSDTPEIPGSTTWGNKNRRMVTTVRFKDLKTRKDFYAMDTHFDHEVQIAREKSAELVRKRIADLKTTLPILLIGDFNAPAGKNKAYQMLVDDKFFDDTWNLAKERKGEGLGTFNGFKAVPQNGNRIDWILIKGKCNVDREEIAMFSKDGKFPSDHCPVVADLRLSD